MASTPKFNIPQEFQAQLLHIEPDDKRTNQEILVSLEQYTPITSEKNIWAYWDKGVRNMPAWCQRNVVDWVRICGPSWTVRILDTVPGSPTNALEYISADLLPEAFVKGTMTGVYTGPHSSDFLRGACLYSHGGVYMDTGNILIRDLDRVCWNQLADPSSPYEVCVPIMYATVMANHFVASRKGDPFIKCWHDLFIHLWKDRQNHEGLIYHPLLAFALTLTFEESQQANFKWDFKVAPQTVMEYISQVLSWQRLCMLEDAGDGFNATKYWLNKVLVYDSLQENWAAEATIGFGGPVLFNALATRLDTPKDSDEYKTAYKLVWRLLTKSTLQKITHGKNLTQTPAAGVLWEEPGNEDKDHEPGTFAELFRYGTVHFRQTRETIRYVKAEKPATTLKKGLLEP
ncbi:hypothetical protein CLCR_04147 [Cladophialophora carrionii]|uniref:Capsule polysaccharide biosynthesis protein n=1 Tax=Cladophialophora carrionii TaxID=86049 RepID=A0A1C1CIC0_9EURO|nr:hypothetical protein CLCR_04147 [Cladophialophora carrionii]